MAGHLLRTPLYQVHVALGAKMGEFAGWLMPIWYSSVLKEHAAVRSAAGLFDVSHLSKFEITGDSALDFVQFVTTNDAGRLKTGEAQYTLLCRDDGGIVDDAILYRLADRYLLVGNAASAQKTHGWLTSHLIPRCHLDNATHELAILALQGPLAGRALGPLVGQSLPSLPWFKGLAATISDVRTLLFRGGYTGEDGFELFCAAGDAVALWQALMSQRLNGTPAASGLAARDILRLEAGLRLYGQDIDESVNPIEAGLGWAVSLDKGEFIGRAAVLEARIRGVERKLVGLKISQRGLVPRTGDPIVVGGRQVGQVTSGGFSPCLNRGIALGYLPASLAKVGTRVDILIRGSPAAAEGAGLPFCRRKSDGS